MASPMTRAQIARQLQRGLNMVFGMKYKMWDEEWRQCGFAVDTSEKAYEEDVQMIGLAGAYEKAEGTDYTIDGGSEGYAARYVNLTFGLGVTFTEEAREDGLYLDIAKTMGSELARAHQYTKEVRHANIFNRAFNTSYKGGDGVELCGAHTLWNGDTLQNELATPADLSEESLEDLCIAIEGATNERGVPRALKPQKLLVHRENDFNAQRILNSTARPGTALNDTNAIKSMGKLPGGHMVNHYFTDPDAWFIIVDGCEKGLRHFVRKKIARRMYVDDKNGNMTYTTRERYAEGWTEYCQVWGSEGSGA